jgi:hypothetical protein
MEKEIGYLLLFSWFSKGGGGGGELVMLSVAVSGW